MVPLGLPVIEIPGGVIPQGPLCNQPFRVALLQGQRLAVQNVNNFMPLVITEFLSRLIRY
jgi:hypothetical protein